MFHCASIYMYKIHQAISVCVCIYKSPINWVGSAFSAGKEVPAWRSDPGIGSCLPGILAGIHTGMSWGGMVWYSYSEVRGNIVYTCPPSITYLGTITIVEIKYDSWNLSQAGEGKYQIYLCIYDG